MTDNDTQYLKLAISRSNESTTQGHFPAGAAIVADYLGEPPTFSTISGDATDFRHAEVRAIEGVVEQHQSTLDGAVLYASMEPCLMCLATAYWAGIRKVVYAIPKSKVKAEYYESSLTSESVNAQLLEPLEMIHLEELEGQALEIVRDWEKLQDTLAE
jgi:guanine deaminase